MIRKHFHDLSYDGKLLSDFGVHVSGESSFASPEKEVELVKVPGRSGDLHISTGRFENVAIKYPAFIFDNFEANFRSLRNYVLSRKSYCRLEDTYHPDEFRMAIYKGPLNPTVTLLQAGTFDLEFQCKPQRYLKSGEMGIDYTSSSTIFNPTSFESYPLIRIYGTGNFGIGDYTITVKSGSGRSFIDVDCDLMDAYSENVNCNAYVTFYTPTGRSRITIEPGNNGITKASTISKVTIWPRWWMI